MRSEHRRTALNVGGLVGGFALGQGSMFVAQTALILRDEVERLAALGLGMTFMTLAYHTVDFGGTVVLARRQAEGLPPSVMRGAIALRLFIAAFVTVAMAVAAVVIRDRLLYVSGLLTGGSLGLLPWATNATGLLDGSGRSGVSGVVGSIPWILASALAGWIVPDDPFAAGAAVGVAFSLGSISILPVQWWLVEDRFPFRWGESVGTTVSREYAIESGSFFIGWLPGQLFNRAQLVVVSAALGLSATGAFIYARQILSALTQLIHFVRRAEFPRLVRDSASADLSLGWTLRAQRSSMIVSVLCSVLALGGATAGVVADPRRFSDAAVILALLVPTLPIAAAAAGAGQVVVAIGRTSHYAATINFSLAIGLLALAALLGSLQVAAVLWSEILMYSIQVLLFSATLARWRPPGIDLPGEKWRSPERGTPPRKSFHD